VQDFRLWLLLMLLPLLLLAAWCPDANTHELVSFCNSSNSGWKSFWNDGCPPPSVVAVLAAVAACLLCFFRRPRASTPVR